MAAPPDPPSPDPSPSDARQPAPAPPEAAQTPRPLPPRPPKRDYAAEEEAERQLTNAHIQLRRGQTSEAETAVRAILAARPGDAAAQELLGDILAAKGDWDAAAAAYQTSLKQQPGRASAEAKFGKLTLRRAERERQEKLGVAYAATETAMVRREGGARGAWPVILGSALCPGLGQVVQGQTLKGSILIGIFLLGVVLLTLLPHDSPSHAHLGFAFWLGIALVAGDWIYAVADAAQVASRKED